MINLSHLRSNSTLSASSAPNGGNVDASTKVVQGEARTTTNPSTETRLISLTHIKSSVLLNDNNNEDSSSTEGETVFSTDTAVQKNSTDSTSASRIRPNSTFLRRYVGSVEKSNERIPIAAVPPSSCQDQVSPESVIEELKAAATNDSCGGLKNADQSYRAFQQEGERKIKDLARRYGLHVEVTYRNISEFESLKHDDSAAIEKLQLMKPPNPTLKSVNKPRNNSTSKREVVKKAPSSKQVSILGSKRDISEVKRSESCSKPLESTAVTKNKLFKRAFQFLDKADSDKM